MPPMPPDQAGAFGGGSVVDHERLISRSGLRDFIPISDMALYRWLQAKKFPPPIYVGNRRFWKVSEIEAWLKTQSEARQFQDQGDE